MKNKFPKEYQNRKRFFNPYQRSVKRHFWNVILWKLGFYNDQTRNNYPPKSFAYPVNKNFEQSNDYCIWINHCTFLISSKKINILTDPIFSNYCAPFPLYSLKRRHGITFNLNDLPKIDYVLISHNHYDHLDKKSVMQLNRIFPDIKWIIPLKLSKWFTKIGIKNTYELNWWQEKLFNNDLKITAVPSQHFSGRGLFSMNKTFWNGYVVQFMKNKKKLYFVGDTGYNPFDFTEIGSKLGPMDLSLIPIGTYCPRQFMKPVHVDPNEAVAIHKEVKSKFSIGMHWKTFKLSDEPLNLPPYDLYKAMSLANLPHDEFVAIDPGSCLSW